MIDIRVQRNSPKWILLILIVACVFAGSKPSSGQQPIERVRPVSAAVTPLPEEAQSAKVKKFSFLAYGDTRSMQDGVSAQPVHSQLISSMMEVIQRLQSTKYPVRFVLQSGDAVTNGRDAKQWNASFVDLVSRITKQANVPYFLVPGNHDVTASVAVENAARKEGLRNYLDAMSENIPREGTIRRLAGYPTFAFGYGNTFVLGMDSDISPDDTQYNWVKSQLEGLNRKRYKNIIVALHHGPFTSGPHGANPEPATLGIRSRYMPLFRKHHVNAVIGGHEHLFEHWVEHYQDAAGKHRMDLIVTAGGGAPLYAYMGEPDTTAYLVAGAAEKVSLDHIVKPSRVATENPFHFIIVRVDGKKLSVEVVTTASAGSKYQPYGKDVFKLRD